MDDQPPLSSDADHNVLLAMVRWVEEGIAPDNLTSVHYRHGDASQGVEFTRPICKASLGHVWRSATNRRSVQYPLSVRFVDGDPNSASSFECALLT